MNKEWRENVVFSRDFDVHTKAHTPRNFFFFSKAINETNDYCNDFLRPIFVLQELLRFCFISVATLMLNESAKTYFFFFRSHRTNGREP